MTQSSACRDEATKRPRPPRLFPLVAERALVCAGGGRPESRWERSPGRAGRERGRGTAGRGKRSWDSGGDEKDGGREGTGSLCLPGCSVSGRRSAGCDGNTGRGTRGGGRRSPRTLWWERFAPGPPSERTPCSLGRTWCCSVEGFRVSSRRGSLKLHRGDLWGGTRRPGEGARAQAASVLESLRTVETWLTGSLGRCRHYAHLDMKEM